MARGSGLDGAAKAARQGAAPRSRSSASSSPATNASRSDALRGCIDKARDNRGDWLAMLDDFADELAVEDAAKAAELRELVENARSGKGDWLGALDLFADDLDAPAKPKRKAREVTLPPEPNRKRRGHALLTKTIARSLPPIKSTGDVADPFEVKARLKLFAHGLPWSRAYITEFDGENELYGYFVAANGEGDWTYASFDLLEKQLVGVGGQILNTGQEFSFKAVAVERDCYWSPGSVRDSLVGDGYESPLVIDDE